MLKSFKTTSVSWEANQVFPFKKQKWGFSSWVFLMKKVLIFWHAPLSIGSLHCIITLSGKWLRFSGKKIYKAFKMLCVVPVLVYSEWSWLVKVKQVVLRPVCSNWEHDTTVLEHIISSSLSFFFFKCWIQWGFCVVTAAVTYLVYLIALYF